MKKGIDFVTKYDDVNKTLSISLTSFPLSELNEQPQRELEIDQKTVVLEDVNLNSLSQRPIIKKKLQSMLQDFIGEDKNTTVFTAQNTLESGISTETKPLDSSYQTKKHGNYVRKNRLHGVKKTKPKNNEKKETFLESITRSQQKLNRVPTFSNENNNSDDYLVFDLHFFQDRNTKTINIEIDGYNMMADCHHQRNKIFSTSHFYNLTHQKKDEEIFKIIEPHLKLAAKKGKKVCFHSLADNRNLVVDCLVRLQEEGLNLDIEFSTKSFSSPSVKSANEKSKKEIDALVLKKYNKLSDLSDKNVVYCDGAEFVSNYGEYDTFISGAFIFRKNGEADYENCEFIKSDDNFKHSDGAELLALQNAIIHTIKTGNTDKPLHIVFDSNLICRLFENTMRGISEAKEERFSKPLNEMKKMIENSGLVVKTSTLKSHQNLLEHEKHSVVKYNEKVDKLTRRNSHLKVREFRTKPQNHKYQF